MNEITNIPQYLKHLSKILWKNNQKSFLKLYYDFCYDNMKEIKCSLLTNIEKQKIQSIINKIKIGDYYDFPAVKDCFFNSILISMFSDNTIEYVEGWYWNIIPTEHGWCKINNKYFDPTILWNNEKFNDEIEYFGMEIDNNMIVDFGVTDLDGKNPEVHCVIPNLIKKIIMESKDDRYKPRSVK